MTSRTLVPGDVVCFTRYYPVDHLALYIGHNQVVHLWAKRRFRFKVRVDSLRFVTNNYHSGHVKKYSDELDGLMLAKYGLRPFNGAEIVRRAMSRLYRTRYDFLLWNCEHFVTWARYGFEVSPQIRKKLIPAAVIVAEVAAASAIFAVVGLSLLLLSAGLASSASLSSSMDENSGRHFESTDGGSRRSDDEE